jgi:hypothetical protein
MTLALIPNGLSVMSTYNGLSLRITWQPVQNVTGYNLYRSQIAYDRFTVVASNIPGITYFNTPPTPNDSLDNMWWYRVSSIDGVGESSLSGPSTYRNYGAFDNTPVPHLSWSALF